MLGRRFPCKYQQPVVCYGFKVVQDFVHPQYLDPLDGFGLKVNLLDVHIIPNWSAQTLGQGLSTLTQGLPSNPSKDVDARNPALPKKPWNIDSPPGAPKHCFLFGQKALPEKSCHTAKYGVLLFVQ